MRFGSVPSLKGLGLICGATIDHQEFSLSQVLHGTRNIHTLTLDFEGERLWIQPEGKQLCHAFKQLRKLSICGIFVDFDLLWTINLLEAAPSVEIFSVRVLFRSFIFTFFSLIYVSHITYILGFRTGSHNR